MKTLAVYEKPQLSVGIRFMLMGVDLSAYYQKTTNGYAIFLAPSNLDNNVQLSVSEIVAEFNKMAGGGLTEDDIKKKVGDDVQLAVAAETDEPVQLDWSKIKFCLKMLFLNIKSETKDGKEDKSVEYALSLQIIADELLPKDIHIFNVDSLSFNIWNTQRTKVLEHMALIEPEAY